MFSVVVVNRSNADCQVRPDFVSALCDFRLGFRLCVARGDSSALLSSQYMSRSSAERVCAGIVLFKAASRDDPVVSWRTPMTKTVAPFMCRAWLNHTSNAPVDHSIMKQKQKQHQQRVTPFVSWITNATSRSSTSTGTGRGGMPS